LLIVILTVGMLSACKKMSGYKKNTETVSVYFKDASTNSLNEEKHKVEIGKNTGNTDLAKIAIQELIEGPENEKNVPVISNEARLLSLAINDSVATINMSLHFLDKEGTDEILLIFAVVNTLCSIEGIDGVVINVEGKPITRETGEEYGVIRMSDMALNTENKTTLTLYFPDKNGEKLVAENRTVDIQQALSLEKAIVSELLKGTENSELSGAVAEGTKLLSIETKENVCYVNFSSEFVSKSSSGTAATTLSLYSIVNSLCELKTVDSVQILVDGKADIEFGNYVLDIPYEANYDLVK